VSDVIDFLNKNSGALSVVFTAVVTLATAIYAALTWMLVRETSLMRQVQTEPKLEIIVRSLEIAIHIVRLHIKNIGLGPALNVRFKPTIVSGGDAAARLLTEFTAPNFFSTGVAYLGPGQERLSAYTQMTQDHDGKIAAVLAFNVEYQSATGKQYREVISIDMSEFKGSYQLGKPHLYAIAQSLERIEKDIGHLTSGFRRLRTDVYTAADRQAEQQESREALEAMRRQAGA
jgi:hypothetical protein